MLNRTWLCVGLAIVLLVCSTRASGQPSNVRAWYAQGQVFVVWEFPAPPAAPTDTVEIYASVAAQPDVSLMTRVGRLFHPEYTGLRLQALVPVARLGVPTPGGGVYRLAANEGVFAYTPRAAGALFFAVVDTGSSAVAAGNSAATAFNYDPVLEPVRPHPQLVGVTPGGNAYTAYVVWADGRDDYTNARPDVPVLADADKNGVPHVFTVSRPTGGAVATPAPCVVALHGGGGEYQLFLPGVPARANVSLGMIDGIVVTPDDSVYAASGGVLDRTNTSWFGYAPEFNPFALVQTEPPPTATVVNFTSRRVAWILDWLAGPGSPAPIDTDRVAIVGHSGGGRGASVISRQFPQRFCAAVLYTPASSLLGDVGAGGQVNYLRGGWDQNLATNLIGPAGLPVSVTEAFTLNTRIDAGQRDFPPTTVFYGKRDTEGPAAWTPSQRAVCDALNDSAMGFAVSWDEREHGVEKWNTEENDATDGFAGPWPDIGQWVAPIKTRRTAAQTLVEEHRAGRTYPGFSNVDADALTPGRQPDPGPGDPDLGDRWGTWGGYLAFDGATLTDTPSRWGATIYLTALSATAIDNSPFLSVTTDVTVRRPGQFRPPEGRTVRWGLTDATTGAVLAAGPAVVGPEGLVTISGLTVPRDPIRVRLSIGACAADFDSSGVVTVADIFAYLTAWFAFEPTAEMDGLPGVTVADIFAFLSLWFARC